MVDADRLAALLADNIDDPHFGLVLDTAAIHAPTGRVLRLHRWVDGWV